MPPLRYHLAPLLLTLLVVSVSHAQDGAPDANHEAESRAAIEAKTAAWADAMIQGTVPHLIPDLFTVGAIRIGAGRQQKGQEAILEHAHTFPSYADAKFEVDDLQVLEDVAYGSGRYSIRLQDGTEGEGMYLKVWRRDADGEWRIDRIMFD